MKLSLGCRSEFPGPPRSDIVRGLRHRCMRKFAGHSHSGIYTALPAVEFDPPATGFGVQRWSSCSTPSRVILEHPVSNSRAIFICRPLSSNPVTISMSAIWSAMCSAGLHSDARKLTWLHRRPCWSPDAAHAWATTTGSSWVARCSPSLGAARGTRASSIAVRSSVPT